jgi:hypothetical protein
VCKSYCRHEIKRGELYPVGCCMFVRKTGRACTFYHPTQQELDTGRQILATRSDSIPLDQVIETLRKQGFCENF